MPLRRIAWVGPTPTVHGGAPFVGTQLLLGLADAGTAIDCYINAPEDHVADAVRAHEQIRIFSAASSWEWGRWYSRTPMGAFFSGHAARLKGQAHNVDRIVDEHRRLPYDVLYQFSQSEFTPLRRRRPQLPPIVVHPSTHAAGELRWHRAEADLSRRAETRQKRAVARATLTARAALQRRELPTADRVLGVSRRFTEHLARDYGIPADRLGVVINPIDLARFSPAGREVAPDGPLTVLFVSRMSVRKGVDQVIALSHRLADLEGRLRILLIGGATSWSDYRPLLADLNTAVAKYHPHIAPDALADLMRTADVLVQPSRYEPFGLTIAEALASGLPVVASDEVGAIDGVAPEVCAVHAAGDVDALEQAVRDALARARDPERGARAARARREAERLFAPERIVRTLAEELAAAAQRAVRAA